MGQDISIQLASLLAHMPAHLVWLAALGMAIGVPSLRGARVTLAVAAILALGTRMLVAIVNASGIRPFRLIADGNDPALESFLLSFVYGLPHAVAIGLLLLALWQTHLDRQRWAAACRNDASRNSP